MCATTTGPRLPACPACGHRRFRKLFTKKGRDFWRCCSCGLERLFPLPTLEEQKQYYDRSYAGAMYREFSKAAEVRRLIARRRLREVLPHSRGGRWLDVGCSSGQFVEELRRQGFEAEGIDISAVAVEHGRQRGLPLTCATIDRHDPPYLYQTVTCFDLLEHVLDPAAFVRQVDRLLAADGTLVLSMPNLHSISRLLTGRHWHSYVPDEHLYYFTPAVIRRLLRREGFDVVRCRPTAKPLSCSYSLVQLKEHSPLTYRVLSVFSKLLPGRFRELIVPLYIGEMTVIARRRPPGPDYSPQREIGCHG